LGAGFGFNAGPQGNQSNTQQFQGGSGNLGFPQASQGGQGSFPPQENFNSRGGFAGNAARRGGQGSGNQRNFKNTNFRGGRPTYKARANNNLGGAGVNSKASAGSSGLDHSKANLGESSSTNVSAGMTFRLKARRKRRKSRAIAVVAMAIFCLSAIQFYVSIVSRLGTIQMIAIFSQPLNLS
jgi:hypothetical protein